jgi:phage terminase small subunit
LTEKQKRFCDEYLIDLNGTRAYKTAYPSVKSDEVAKAAASRMLSNVNVRAYLDERLEQLRSERTADIREILEYLTAVMRGEEKEEKMAANALGEMEAYNVRNQANQLKAAELLGKRFGLFTDKLNVEGNIPVVIAGDDKIAD